ncbi:hypothetical protein BsWGS_05914 [Bradybaena similaris]
MTKAEEITTCKMKCLRKAVNVTRRDCMRNDIRKMVKTPCKDYIERQKIRWFGHLMRTDPTKPPLLVYTSRWSGYRAKGRPRKKMDRQYCRDIQKTWNDHDRCNTKGQRQKTTSPHNAFTAQVEKTINK